MTVRLGVLVSGSGSNLQALIDACATEGFPAELAVVVSNVPTAFALERARKAGIPAEAIDHKSFAGRDAFEAALQERLKAHRVEVVCLAGFMRILSARFLEAFPGKVLNIHPSLLPAFPGLHGARQALAHGSKIAGCTVHFVDPGLDSGPIIIQAAVPVLPEDTEQTLAARILEQEHRIYPLAVRWLCEGRLTVKDRTVHLAAEPVVEGVALRSPGRVTGGGGAGAVATSTHTQGTGGGEASGLEALHAAKTVLVSACLAGEHCRYDARSAESSAVAKALAAKEVVPVCPEVASGLPIPRPPVELHGGTGRDVLAGRATARVKETGSDATASFSLGARIAVEAAKRYGATVAILKERSPSCGTHQVYVDGQLRAGEGVTAAALKAAGVVVLSDEDLRNL